MVDTEEMILAVGIEGPGQPDVRNLGGGLNSSTKGPAASQGSGRVDLLLLVLLSRFSCVRLCATPEMAAHQAPPSLGFSRQEHWSGLPFPSPMHENEK